MTENAALWGGKSTGRTGPGLGCLGLLGCGDQCEFRSGLNAAEAVAYVLEIAEPLM
jgi:hypothetical protein